MSNKMLFFPIRNIEKLLLYLEMHFRNSICKDQIYWIWCFPDPNSFMGILTLNKNPIKTCLFRALCISWSRYVFLRHIVAAWKNNNNLSTNQYHMHYENNTRKAWKLALIFIPNVSICLDLFTLVYRNGWKTQLSIVLLSRTFSASLLIQFSSVRGPK